MHYRDRIRIINAIGDNVFKVVAPCGIMILTVWMASMAMWTSASFALLGLAAIVVRQWVVEQ